MGQAQESKDLSDEEIQQLLKEAEEHLRHKNASKRTTATESLERFTSLPKLNAGELERPYIQTKSNVALVDSARVVSAQDRKKLNQTRKVEDPIVVKKRAAETKKATAGPSWFDLPRTNLTPELKRDIQLLRMRSVLDPKRHYKKEDTRAAPPEYSQVGTVIEGPTEFYSARIPKKERKRTFVEEVMAGEHETGRFKRKYEELQVKKRSGKKAHLKARMERRAKKFTRR